eukprot:NODE_458_length_7216_cov_0.728537.p1 type:complete len:490 gc:universal NODE_458_length_7216_cov_0.728537:4917-6386(+)
MNPIECPVGAMALFLFFRFNFTDENFPNVHVKQDWYDIFLLFGDKGIKSKLDYSSHLKTVTKILKECNIDSGKCKTHLQRKSGVRMLDEMNCREDHVDRLGGWKHDKKTTSYLLNIATEAMKLMSGGSKIQGSYQIYRDAFIPSLNLQQLVFPGAFKYDLSDPMLEKTAVNFINLMKYLAIVVLQDAAILINNEDIKSHAIFKCDLFRSNEFIEFSKLVNDHHRTMSSRPLNEVSTLAEVSPDICQMLSSQHHYFSRILSEQAELKNQIFQLNQQLHQFYSFQICQPILASFVNPQMSINHQNYHPNTPNYSPQINPKFVSIQSSNLSTVSSLRNYVRQASYQSTSSQKSSPDSAISNINQSHLEEEKHAYRLNNETKCLKKLCVEYYDGTLQCPAYSSLEKQFKSEWRRGSNSSDSAKNRQFWKGRLDCIKEIERLEVSTGLSRHAVVEMIVKFKDGIEIAKKSATIPWLIKYMKNNKDKSTRTYGFA